MAGGGGMRSAGLLVTAGGGGVSSAGVTVRGGVGSALVWKRWSEVC